MKFNFEQVFITGGSGWLGKSLINTLLNGDNLVLEEFKPINSQLFALEYDKNYFDNSKIKIIKGDIRSIKDCNHFMKNNINGMLYHCAGIIHPNKVSDFYEVNLKGTINIGSRQNGRIQTNSIINSTHHYESIFKSIKKLYSKSFQKTLCQTKNPLDLNLPSKKCIEIIKNKNLSVLNNKYFNDVLF